MCNYYNSIQAIKSVVKGAFSMLPLTFVHRGILVRRYKERNKQTKKERMKERMKEIKNEEKKK
jgi:hypothetical protein